MQQTQVNIYPGRNSTFLTSYVHPLTKRKVRQNFTCRFAAQDFKHVTELRFSTKKPDTYADLTIEELLVMFLNAKPKNPFSRRKRHLIDFVETFGDYKLHEITSDAMKVWLDQIQKENTLKDITMRGLKCEIDTLFNYLEEKEVISESPLNTIYYKKYVPPLKTRNLLTDQQIEELLSSIKAYSPGYLYPIIKLFTETGAKIAEVIELEWKEVNLQNGIVFFKSRVKNQERKLKISDELIGILSKRKRRSNLVFQTYYKEPFTKAKLTRTINEFKQKKTYKGQWGPMDLRHSFAVNFLKKGGDIRELQRTLGHNNVFDTKRLYGELVNAVPEKNITNPFQ